LDEAHSLKSSVARAIFLTTQEALANIARHARAGKVLLDLRRTGTAVQLQISDDGLGFDINRRNLAIGHGLSNMRSRAASLNGTFEIISTEGQGTKILLTLPFR
jgi:signal transduction histidine kinase